jgi:serine/threonine-protein kinase HipA
MSVCRICLETTRGDAEYHPRCVKSLFGATKIPTLDIEVSKLHTAALAMVGHTSLSGIQKKISVNLGVDRETLQVAAEGGLYILKPQTGTYPALPENEHVTTRLAQLVGIETAPAGLVALKDGTLAYVVRRFDRLAGGGKVRQEDFCQLAEKSPKDKYDGSAELCVRLLRKYASEPLIEIRKLYRLLVFVWWSGNGDMHLKNFSVLIDSDGRVRLTPAYDLVATNLVIANDPLALAVSGKKTKLRRSDWLEFAEYCQLSERVAAPILERQAKAVNEAQGLIERSFLPDEQRQQYQQLIQDRSALISG